MSRYNITAQQNKPYLLPKQMVNQFEGTDEEKAAFNFAINQMDYIMAESFCEQIGVLCSHLRNPPLKVSYERIGKLFDESRHLIWDMEKNYIRGPGVDGRPCTLNDNELNILRGLINQLLYNPAFRIYPTFAEISDLIYTNFKKYISQDTLRHLFYTKFSDDYKTCIGVPMDKDRVEASLIDIETNLMQLVVFRLLLCSMSMRWANLISQTPTKPWLLSQRIFQSPEQNTLLIVQLRPLLTWLASILMGLDASHSIQYNARQ